MGIDELTEIATDFLRENYGLILDIPVRRNNRLRRALGRYGLTHDNRPKMIEISGEVLNYAADEVIIDILKHECIHYAMHVLGRPFDDGDQEFEDELNKYGVTGTNILAVGRVYVYTCGDCGKAYETMLKSFAKRPHKYKSPCCGGSAIMDGELIYDGISCRRESEKEAVG